MQQPRDIFNRTIPNTFSPTGQTEKLTSSGTSTPQSAAFNASRDIIVRLICNADCHYECGVSPTATTASNYLPAKAGEQIKLIAGHKIAVIGNVDFYIRELV
jgi:hypothetical protein